MNLPERVYVVALGLWAAWVALGPTWVGRTYRPADWPGASGVYAAGEFALDRDDAPVWDPPRAPTATASVRWPWQRSAAGNWIEPDLGAAAWRLSVGAVALGLILAAWHRLRRAAEPGPVGRVASAVSLWLVVGWLVLAWVGAFTMGLGLVDEVLEIVLLSAAAVGIGYGLWARRRDRRAPAAAAPARALGWFVVGLVVAGVLTVGAAWGANAFRGPIAGGTELGTPDYARDQTPVNMATGMLIVAVGAGLAGLARWRRMSGGLVLGLAVGAAVLGLAFALHK